jgi:hypothetical protein
MRSLSGAVCLIALAANAMAQLAIDNSQQKKTAAKPNIAANPYNGSWRFVPGKSHFSEASAGLRSLIVNVHATRSKFDWTATGEDSAGQEVALAYGGAIDGKPHPVAGDPNAATITYTSGANDALDATWKDAKGNIYGTQHLTLSADKKTITLRGEFKDPKGKEVTSTEVYDKAGGATAAAKNTPETKKE